MIQKLKKQKKQTETLVGIGSLYYTYNAKNTLSVLLTDEMIKSY